MYGEKLTWFQRFMLRFQPDPLDVVKAELKQAKLAELQSISQAEYADLRMQMHTLTAEYHRNRAGRMEQFIADAEYDPADAMEAKHSVAPVIKMTDEEFEKFNPAFAS